MPAPYGPPARLDPDDCALLARTTLALADNPHAALIDEGAFDPTTLVEFGEAAEAAARVLAATEGDPTTQAPASARDLATALDLLDALRLVYADPDADLNGGDLVEYIGRVVGPEWDPENNSAEGLARWYGIIGPESDLARAREQVLDRAEAAYDSEGRGPVAEVVADFALPLADYREAAVTLLDGAENESSRKGARAYDDYVSARERGNYAQAWRAALNCIDHFAEALDL